MRFGIARDRLSDTWVVYRIGGEPEQHCHMKKIGACKRLVAVIKARQYPYSPWMQESARRLLTDEEFNALRRPKDRYVNKRKGT